MDKIIKGGMFAGRRTYIISGAGILSAIAMYLAGDENIFNTLNTIFTLGGIYFLRKSNDSTQEKKNGRPKSNRAGKISE
jgi:hypothetical protein